MSKTAINLYSATPALNTDVDGINIDEGMAPSNVNNSIRAIMSHLKEQDDGTSSMTSPDINGGAIDGAAIGANSASTGAFTTLSASSDASVTGNLDVSNGVDVTGAMYASGNIGLDSTDFISFTNNTRMDVTINGSNEFRFESDGDFHADGDVIAFSTTVASDERLKENITDIENALEKVKQISGVTFNYKEDNRPSAGVIAQQIENVLPVAVSEKELPFLKDDGQKYKVVNYDALHGLLIEAIKELSAEIEELKRGTAK